MFKVKQQYLLLWACFVWVIAGVNIVRIGFEAYFGHVTIFNIFLSFLIFCFFQFLIFGKLVKKHTERIISYQEKQLFIKFFDIKSFIIMVFMMSCGIFFRVSGIVSVRFIAVFYSGLGIALVLAGLLFGVNFGKYIRQTL